MDIINVALSTNALNQNAQDKNVQLIKPLVDSCQFHQFCHPPDVVGGIV